MRRVLAPLLLIGVLTMGAAPAGAGSIPHFCSDIDYLTDVIGRVDVRYTDSLTGGGLIVAANRLEKHATQTKDKKAARQARKLAASVRELSNGYQHGQVSVAALNGILAAVKKGPERC